VFLFFEDCLLN